MFSPSGEQIEISHGDQRAVVVEVGGGLRAYSAGGRELLDAYPADGQITSGRGQVLIPWPNRIEDGAYEFDGRQQQLALDELAARNAIHGLVRWAGWSGRRARAEPGRARARAPSAARLPVLASPSAIEYALTDDGPLGLDDRHQRRPGSVPVRLRLPSVPDSRHADRRLARPDGAGANGPERERARPPHGPVGGGGDGVRLQPSRGRSARLGSTTASPTSSATTASPASSSALPTAPG